MTTVNSALGSGGKERCLPSPKETGSQNSRMPNDCVPQSFGLREFYDPASNSYHFISPIDDGSTSNERTSCSQWIQSARNHAPSYECSYVSSLLSLISFSWTRKTTHQSNGQRTQCEPTRHDDEKTSTTTRSGHGHAWASSSVRSHCTTAYLLVMDNSPL